MRTLAHVVRSKATAFLCGGVATSIPRAVYRAGQSADADSPVCATLDPPLLLVDLSPRRGGVGTRVSTSGRRRYGGKRGHRATGFGGISIFASRIPDGRPLQSAWHDMGCSWLWRRHYATPIIGLTAGSPGNASRTRVRFPPTRLFCEGHIGADPMYTGQLGRASSSRPYATFLSSTCKRGHERTRRQAPRGSTKRWKAPIMGRRWLDHLAPTRDPTGGTAVSLAAPFPHEWGGRCPPPAALKRLN